MKIHQTSTMDHDTFDWETCSPRTADIPLGTHSLSLSCFGQTRAKEQPAVIIIPGITSSNKEWPVIIREVSGFARTYAYDRSGFGSSGVSPHAQTAGQIASELDCLLAKARIDPPYVIACHSYGGIIAREFIHCRGAESMAGIVFVDANTEETPLTFPNPAVQAMQRSLNTPKVTIGQSHKLSSEEWNALLAEEDNPKHEEAGNREIESYHASGRALMAKKQIDLQPPLLGDRPLAVLHANYALDLQKIYNAGCALGNGTLEERKKMAEFIVQANDMEERMQRKMLTLSTNGKFTHVPDSGHYIHMVNPEAVIDAVKWVLDEAEGIDKGSSP